MFYQLFKHTDNLFICNKYSKNFVPDSVAFDRMREDAPRCTIKWLPHSIYQLLSTNPTEKLIFYLAFERDNILLTLSSFPCKLSCYYCFLLSITFDFSERTCSISLLRLIKTNYFWAVGVVKWSACSPSTLMIRFLIKSLQCQEKNKFNKKRPGTSHLKRH